MENENLTAGTQPEASGDVSDGQATDSNAGGADALTQFNEMTGKNFKSLEDAAKSYKETSSYVGKQKEVLKQELASEMTPSQVANQGEDINSQLASLQKELRDSNFYRDNPQYKEFSDVISKMGDNPQEVVSSDSFKKVFEPAQAYKEIEQSKSVLKTNPRLGKVTDKIADGKKMAQEGNYTAAKKNAASAVIDAFNL